MGDARGIGRRRVLEGAGALLLTASMPRALAAVGTKKPSLVLAPLRTTVGNGVEGGLGVFDLEAGTPTKSDYVQALAHLSEAVRELQDVSVEPVAIGSE